MTVPCPKCRAADPMYSKMQAAYVCEEWGSEIAPEKPFEKQRNFISYGRDEHISLALRLHDDFRERGHEAWIDEELVVTRG